MPPSPPKQEPQPPPPPPPQPAPAPPRPVSAPGKPVQYLTDEEKARLNAKCVCHLPAHGSAHTHGLLAFRHTLALSLRYGRLKQPTADDMKEVLASGSNCKMQ